MAVGRIEMQAGRGGEKNDFLISFRRLRIRIKKQLLHARTRSGVRRTRRAIDGGAMQTRSRFREKRRVFAHKNATPPVVFSFCIFIGGGGRPHYPPLSPISLSVSSPGMQISPPFFFFFFHPFSSLRWWHLLLVWNLPLFLALKTLYRVHSISFPPKLLSNYGS